MQPTSYQERLRQHVQLRASAVSPLTQPSNHHCQSSIQALYKASQGTEERTEGLSVSLSPDSRPHPKPHSCWKYETIGTGPRGQYNVVSTSGNSRNNRPLQRLLV
jgi:hypothetical protein